MRGMPTRISPSAASLKLEWQTERMAKYKKMSTLGSEHAHKTTTIQAKDILPV